MFASKEPSYSISLAVNQSLLILKTFVNISLGFRLYKQELAALICHPAIP